MSIQSNAIIPFGPPSLETLPREIKIEIMKKLPIQDLLRLSMTSRSFNRIIDNEKFWEERYHEEFPYMPEPAARTWKERIISVSAPHSSKAAYIYGREHCPQILCAGFSRFTYVSFLGPLAALPSGFIGAGIVFCSALISAFGAILVGHPEAGSSAVVAGAFGGVAATGAFAADFVVSEDLPSAKDFAAASFSAVALTAITAFGAVYPGIVAIKVGAGIGAATALYLVVKASAKINSQIGANIFERISSLPGVRNLMGRANVELERLRRWWRRA